MIDLHLHTKNSDGDFSVLEILEKAKENKLEVISITDHNNVDAYAELTKVRDVYKGKIISGTELCFVHDGLVMEVLGYGFDLNKLTAKELLKKGFLPSTIENETKNLNLLKLACDKLNIIYSKDLKITTHNYYANDVIVDDILTYSENKEILKALEIIHRNSFYRKHVLNRESPFFIDFTAGKGDLSYVSNIIREAGGKCFLAHTFVYGLKEPKKFLEYAVSINAIDGIECYHRRHGEEQIDFLLDFCDKNNLLKSGGSDYHHSKHSIGYADRGRIKIPYDIIDDWINEEKHL